MSISNLSKAAQDQIRQSQNGSHNNNNKAAREQMTGKPKPQKGSYP